LGAALLLAAIGCDNGPTDPAIVDVTVPGTFALQLFQPTEAPFTGTARLASCGLNYTGFSLRSPSWPGEEILMQPALVPVVIKPMPTGSHTFSELGKGSQYWDLSHARKASSGLTIEFGLPISGSVEITESTTSTLRGRIDVTITFYRDSVTPPRTRRLRGSFWAVSDPLCAA
jgi:hypothetical protein